MPHTNDGKTFQRLSSLSVQDVARGLWDVRRWGGATSNGYNVLQHSIATYSLALNYVDDLSFLLFCLWHDTPEMVQGADIARPHKTDEQRAHEQAVLHTLFEEVLGMELVTPSDGFDMRKIDDAVAHAEVVCYCHPNVREFYWQGKPAHEAISATWSAGQLTRGEAITFFVRATERLIKRIVDAHKLEAVGRSK